MCTGLEIAAIAGAAVSAGGAIYAGQKQDDMMQANAAQSQADADTAAGQAQVEARKIREAAKRQRASAAAALASSGVEVGAGTAEMIQQDIGRRGEEDALTTILTGGNRARMLNRQGDLDRIGGSNAATAGYIGGASSALSAGSSYYGWKSKGGGRKFGGNLDDFYSGTRGVGD